MASSFTEAVSDAHIVTVSWKLVGTLSQEMSGGKRESSFALPTIGSCFCPTPRLSTTPEQGCPNEIHSKKKWRLKRRQEKHPFVVQLEVEMWNVCGKGLSSWKLQQSGSSPHLQVGTMWALVQFQLNPRGAGPSWSLWKEQGSSLWLKRRRKRKEGGCPPAHLGGHVAHHSGGDPLWTDYLKKMSSTCQEVSTNILCTYSDVLGHTLVYCGILWYTLVYCVQWEVNTCEEVSTSILCTYSVVLTWQLSRKWLLTKLLASRPV